MKKRIIIVSFIITVCCLIVYTVISATVFYDNFLVKSKDTLKAYAKLCSLQDFDLTDDGAKTASSFIEGKRVVFINEEGVVLGDSKKSLTGEKLVNEIYLSQASKTGEGFKIGEDENGVKNVFYCTEYKDAFLRISINASSYDTVYYKSIPPLISVMVIVVSLGIIALLACTGYIVSPIKDFAYNPNLHTETSIVDDELKPIAKILHVKDKKIEELRQKIKESDTSKDEFISNVTHEMNTPLTSIKGYADLIANDMLPPSAYKKTAEKISKASEKLAEYVKEIINYSALNEDSEPDAVINISKVISDVCDKFAPVVLEKQIVFSSDVKKDVMLTTTTLKVAEVAENLIANAIRYNKVGGSINVTLTQDYLTVADTGIGIAEEDLPKIFSRFYTVDKSHGGIYGGYGLGLAIVKKICVKSGWKISVTSKKDVGTTFKIEF